MNRQQWCLYSDVNTNTSEVCFQNDKDCYYYGKVYLFSYIIT